VHAAPCGKINTPLDASQRSPHNKEEKAGKMKNAAESGILCHRARPIFKHMDRTKTISHPIYFK
jgi:hypothetical protein